MQPSVEYLNAITAHVDERAMRAIAHLNKKVRILSNMLIINTLVVLILILSTLLNT